MSMVRNGKIFVVGCGKMGEAIVSGWLSQGIFGPEAFSVMVATQKKRDYLADRYGITCIDHASDCREAPDLVLLAVKPQVLPVVLEELKGFARENAAFRKALFVSIAAGVPTQRIQQALGFEAAVVRVMPNVALSVGQGASTVCSGAFASADQLEEIRSLFSLLGDAVVVSESLMDVTCALNGSGPAYVAYLIEKLRDSAIAEGLDAATADRLALQTVFGTAALMRQKGQSAEETRISVCSPGGTTLAALSAMDKAGFGEAVQAGVSAAVVRSRELASC